MFFINCKSFIEMDSVTALSLTLIAFIILLVLLSCLFRQKQWLDGSGRTVLITGCDSGFGFRLAKHYHSKGCIVFATVLDVIGEGARQLQEECQKDMIKHDNDNSDKNANEEVNEDIKRLHVVQMDVTSDESVENCLNYVNDVLDRNKLSGLWAVINNAGVCIYGEFDWFTVGQCKAITDVNFLGTLRVTKAFLPLLIKAKGKPYKL